MTKSHHTTNPTQNLLGKTQEGGCLSSGEKQPRREQEAGFYTGFLESRAFQDGLIVGQTQGLVGFRVTLGCLHLKGLDQAVTEVRVFWGAEPGHPLTPQGAYTFLLWHLSFLISINLSF